MGKPLCLSVQFADTRSLHSSVGSVECLQCSLRQMAEPVGVVAGKL